MAVFTRVKTWVSNEILTASDLNGEFNNILNNMEPLGIEDASADVSAMQSTTDPGGVGTESLATTLLGEIQRLRYVIKRIINGAQWYSTPVGSLSTGGITASALASNSVTTAKIADLNVTSAKLESGARQINYQLFTSNGTFTTPAASSTGTVYKVTCVGPGGGGARWLTGAGGGGAGATAIAYVSGLAAGANVTVTVGTGGAGGSSDTAAGNPGSGDTSFGTYCVAARGLGGIGNGTWFRGGAGGQTSACTGDIKFGGGCGTGAATNSSANIQSGNGGSSSFGGGGLGETDASGAADAGFAYGAGGGGGYNQAGGAGADGVCIVEWVI